MQNMVLTFFQYASCCNQGSHVVTLVGKLRKMHFQTIKKMAVIMQNVVSWKLWLLFMIKSIPGDFKTV